MSLRSGLLLPSDNTMTIGDVIEEWLLLPSDNTMLIGDVIEE